MIFVFQSETGEIKEESFPIGQAPPEITVDGIKYVRVFTVPNVIMDMNQPKTIGSLAEANGRKMEKEGKLPKKKEKPTPWWRKDKKKVDVGLANMSAAQKERYIHEGKK